MTSEEISKINQRIKKRTNLYRILFMIGIILEIIKFLIFTIVHGFHIIPVSPYEIIFGGVIEFVFTLGIIIMILAFDDVITILISDI